jgi:hypothetical protein
MDQTVCVHAIKVQRANGGIAQLTLHVQTRWKRGQPYVTAGLTPVHSERDAESAPEAVWTAWSRKDSLISAGIQIPDGPVQSLDT